MYAPDGADADHEWIEVCNTGESADIGNWKFFENDTNHSLSVVSGSSELAAGACAIIADDTTTFALDYPAFTGVLFDSVFSLKNTGEQLQLKDENSVVQDDVTYSDTYGAKDNGLTLHRNGSLFSEGTASPGEESGIVTTQETTNGNSSDSNSTTATNTTTITQYQYEALSVEPPQDIHLRLPKRVETVVEANVTLTAEVYDARGRAINDGRIAWTFGDGTTGQGRSVVHRYKHSGEYLIVVKIVHESLFDEVILPVVVHPLSVSLHVAESGEWLEVHNTTDTILDLSHWRIRAASQYFIIPEGTRVQEQGSVRFDTGTTKLTFLKMRKHAFLLFPDGTTAVESVVFAPSEEETVPTIESEEIPVVVTTAPMLHTSLKLIGTPVPAASITKREIEVPLKESENVFMPTTTTHIAAASAAVHASEENTMLLWVVGLSTLLALGTAGVIAARRSRSLADQFTIIDETPHG